MSRPVDFVGSFPDPVERLTPAMPEFAFIGRSNVGKSSLLNALTGRRSLARVSQTPGKTQFLNVFRLAGFYLIDLPGYGFAQASQVDRAGYRLTLEALLRERQSLTAVVWLLDVRHAPSKDDGEFHRLLTESGRAVLAVLTKADKLAESKREAAVTARASELGLPRDQVLLVSAATGQGIAELATSLIAAAGELP